MECMDLPQSKFRRWLGRGLVPVWVVLVGLTGILTPAFLNAGCLVSECSDIAVETEVVLREERWTLEHRPSIKPCTSVVSDRRQARSRPGSALAPDGSRLANGRCPPLRC